MAFQHTEVTTQLPLRIDDSLIGIRPVNALWQHRHLMLIGLDVIVVVICFLLSYELRFKYQFLAIKEVATPEIDLYAKGAVILASVWVVRLWRAGHYERGLRGLAAATTRVKSLLTNAIYSVATLMVISFLYRELLLSRQVYLMTTLMACSLMLGLRYSFRTIDRNLAHRGFVHNRVAIVGTNQAARDFANSIQNSDSLVRVVGFFTITEDATHDRSSSVVVLGDISAIEKAYYKLPFDKLVLAPSVAAHSLEKATDPIMRILNFCERNNVTLYALPCSFDVSVAPEEISTFSGTPLIQLKDASLHPAYAIVKRIFDVSASVFLLLAGLPLWAAIAWAIRSSSDGSVLFTQLRAGHHGKPFRMYKFRTMHRDAESRLKDLVDLDALSEPVFKIQNDPRVTPIGRFLRRSGLDEIPQLLNVIRGDMSIVGPRPEEVGIVERYAPVHRRRLKAKPGITGYQQIMNRGEPSLSARLRHDLIYLKHQSLLLDLYIIWRTCVVVARGRGVSY